MVALRKKRASAEAEALKPAEETAAEPPVTSAPGTHNENDLQKQLEALRAGEALLRQQREAEIRTQLAAQMEPDKPAPRPQDAPKFTERDFAFMGAGPGIQSDPRLGAAAQNLEAIGIRWGSDRFYKAMESIFPIEEFRRVEPSQGAPANAPAATVHASEPARPSIGLSAPVSREGAVSYSGSRPPDSPTSVRLSRDEREIARASGMTEVEYAKNKIRLAQLKKAGLVQDGG
jgi:hypothetical protein